MRAAPRYPSSDMRHWWDVPPIPFSTTTHYGAPGGRRLLYRTALPRTYTYTAPRCLAYGSQHHTFLALNIRSLRATPAASARICNASHHRYTPVRRQRRQRRTAPFRCASLVTGTTSFLRDDS